VGYHVGAYGNLTRATYGTGSWQDNWKGEFDGINSLFGSGAVFLHDCSSTYGSGTGNGDYHVLDNSPTRNLIPAGKNALPFDLDGRRRRIEGDDAGAYARGLGKAL
jgi:hypothetical protein